MAALHGAVQPKERARNAVHSDAVTVE